MVVLVVMPVSEGKLTLAQDAQDELSEFGGSAMLPG